MLDLLCSGINRSVPELLCSGRSMNNTHSFIQHDMRLLDAKFTNVEFLIKLTNSLQFLIYFVITKNKLHPASRVEPL